MDDALHPLEQDLIAHETQVWTALAQGDVMADAATIASFQLSQMRATPLGRDYAMLSYRADFTRNRKGPAAMFVTSIWQRSGGGWINTFSQDTSAARS